MVDITIVNGVYKPTYSLGAPSCRENNEMLNEILSDVSGDFRGKFINDGSNMRDLTCTTEIMG
jgi:hypothetical protein